MDRKWEADARRGEITLEKSSSPRKVRIILPARAQTDGCLNGFALRRLFVGSL
jgi:hypothetical protein